MNPYFLESWWSMIQHGALIAQVIAGLRDAEWNLSRHIEKKRSQAATPISDWDDGSQHLRSCLALAVPLCQELTFHSALAQVRRIDASLSEGIVPLDLMTRIQHLYETMIDELEQRKFVFIPLNRVDWYQVDDLFGADVAEKFPRAARDIKEAGTCLALDRATAAVFHLMCVLEVGIDSLAHALGMPETRKEWHEILKEIERRVGSLGPNDGADWKDRKEFYSQAVLEFRFFKDAWRNHTMHGRAKFDFDEAKMKFEHVRAFMAHLAKQLQERP